MSYRETTTIRLQIEISRFIMGKTKSHEKKVTEKNASSHY